METIITVKNKNQFSARGIQILVYVLLAMYFWTILVLKVNLIKYNEMFKKRQLEYLNFRKWKLTSEYLLTRQTKGLVFIEGRTSPWYYRKLGATNGVQKIHF